MILGILGGMGPEASIDLFKKIISLTNASKDQEHLQIILDNNTKIPDRTDHILGYGKDPKIEMIRSLIKLELMGADYIAIACNTAHYYYEDIVKFTRAKVINMIYQVGVHLSKEYPNTKEYLLLSTEGTYKSKIYHKVLGDFGLKVLEPNDIDKEKIMTWIYKVKASQLDTSIWEVKALVSKYIDGVNIPIILGCTELPLLFNHLKVKDNMSVEYIDPTWVLAKYCVDLAGLGLYQHASV